MTEKELESLRIDFMLDQTKVKIEEAYSLLKIASKLRDEDTSLNVYELYKHPDVREKLFTQVTEACYLILEITPTMKQKENFQAYLEEQFVKVLKKTIASTDIDALHSLMNSLGVKQQHTPQFIRDVVASGLLSRK
ncbi:hypothetical protein MX075_05405 [Streptococcus uberis]|nr:hypothetical protein [Streptococcus uberis]MCK1257308.1 hypothetical protein [Streptococcus uberis]MCK1258963.1 hypothetical protein [Streptococcus uberis]